MIGARLRTKPDGSVRVLERPENLPPDQLVKLRAYRDELVPIVEVFGVVEVFIRPAGTEPELPRWLELSEKEHKKRRKWLAREPARFGLVNRELPA